jgi:uncharacterized protein (TIGR02231 family)
LRASPALRIALEIAPLALAVLAGAALRLAAQEGAAAGAPEAARAGGAEAEKPAAPVRHVLPITEVVVYEDRALVTREGDVRIQGGGTVETIHIEGLAPNLSETSLRAGLGDPGHGRVISVSSDTERRRDIQDAKLRAVEESRRTAAARLGTVDDDLARIAVREAYLDAYEKLIKDAVSERTGGGNEPEVTRWAEALKFVREGRTGTQAARRESTRRREELAREHADLAAEVERLRRPDERSVRSAEVVVEGAAAGYTRLKLSYVIPGAGWTPRYDARYESPAKRLVVTYFGEVRQRTGEDWNDVRLVLSTARPSVGASRPQVLPLRLSALPLVDEAKAAGKEIAHREVAVPDALTGLDLVPAAEEAPPAPSDGLLAAESKENATSATFTVPGAATVPGDGRPHKVPVTTFSEDAKAAFETVPRLERFVYLKCGARNGSPYPMLSGPVDIYRDSGFIGTSRLAFTAPGRPFEVSLGIEESLKVRRAVTADAWNKRGDEKREGFDIEVANFGEAAQVVTVIENQPVADIEEVVVELDSSTSAPSERDEKDGILKWRLEVPPGGARAVHLEYTVKYPRSQLGK